MKASKFSMATVVFFLLHMTASAECKNVDGDEVLTRFIRALPREESEALKSIDWKLIGNFDGLTDAVPASFCLHVRDYESKHSSDLSFDIFKERSSDKDKFCMRLAEEVGCTLSNICGSSRLVPIINKFDELNQLYPFPETPDCDHLKYRPLLADASSDPKNIDWYREQWRWRTVCIIDGEDIDYVYDHAAGWRRQEQP